MQAAHTRSLVITADQGCCSPTPPGVEAGGGGGGEKRNTEGINSNSRHYSFNRTFRASSALVQISGTQRGSSQLSDHVTGVLGESYFPPSLSWPQSPV